MSGIDSRYSWQILVEFRLPLEEFNDRAAQTASQMAEVVINQLPVLREPNSGVASSLTGDTMRENPGKSPGRLKTALADRFHGAGERACRDMPSQPVLVRVLLESKKEIPDGSWGFFLIEKGPGGAFPQRTLEVYLYSEGKPEGDERSSSGV